MRPRVKNILNETLKDISTLLNVDKETAKIIKKVINGKIDPETFSDVRKWADQCYNLPSQYELIQGALNQIIGTYGTESIVEDNWKSYYHNINFIYCNTGDIYQSTIIFDTENGIFFIGSVGDVMEALNL
jgi:hypothetical protein